jgi:hypothetical protein
MLHLDHIYYDGPLELLALDVHRTRKSLVASDHLPLVADFKYLKGVEPARSLPERKWSRRHNGNDRPDYI